VRALLRARAESEVLQAGSQRSLEAARDVYAFERELDGQRVLVALNFSSRRTPARLPAGHARVLLSTHHERALEEVDTGKLVLEPDEGVVLRSGA
jgi:alpha-glucosidase